MVGMESSMEKQDRMQFIDCNVNEITTNGFELVMKMEDDIPDWRDMVKRALRDSGSMMKTTNDRKLLHCFDATTIMKYLHDAGKAVSYHVRGSSYLIVDEGDGKHREVKCWYTTSLPVTMIGPGEVVSQSDGKLESCRMYYNELTG